MTCACAYEAYGAVMIVSQSHHGDTTNQSINKLAMRSFRLQSEFSKQGLVQNTILTPRVVTHSSLSINNNWTQLTADGNDEDEPGPKADFSSLLDIEETFKAIGRVSNRDRRE